MPFEDLLTPKAPPCKTCNFIETLDPVTQAEVDAAIPKGKYSDLALQRALATLATELTADLVPSDTNLRIHRQRGHRVPA